MIAPLAPGDIPILVALWQACGVTRPRNDLQGEALGLERQTVVTLGKLLT